MSETVEVGSVERPEVAETTALRCAEPVTGAMRFSNYRNLAEFRSQYPGEYLPIEGDPRAVEPFSRPDETVRDINPERGVFINYDVNCADCARAFESTWRGQSELAAGRNARGGESTSAEMPGIPGGETIDRTENWLGCSFSLASQSEVYNSVEQGGHGTSALVAVWYTAENGAEDGHMINIVNYEGSVMYVDAQLGESHEIGSPTDWFPPPYLEKVHNIEMASVVRTKEGFRL